MLFFFFGYIQCIAPAPFYGLPCAEDPTEKKTRNIWLSKHGGKYGKIERSEREFSCLGLRVFDYFVIVD